MKLCGSIQADVPAETSIPNCSYLIDRELSIKLEITPQLSLFRLITALKAILPFTSPGCSTGPSSTFPQLIPR